MASKVSLVFNRLLKFAPQTSKEARDAVSDLLVDLDPLARARGLSNKQVDAAFNLALGGHLSSTDSITLLGLIFPSSPLGAAPILRVVSVLGEGSNSKLQHHGRVQYKVQRRALEMLVQLVELGAVSPQARDALESFWGILEQGLEYKTLRDATAQLMLLITRRYHVQEHRIAHLQRVIRTLEPSVPPSLLRLLSLFRSYYPELVLSSSSSATASGSFSKPFPKTKAVTEWSEEVRRILEGHNVAKGTGGSDLREAKRRKTTYFIPSGTTYSAGTTSTPVSDITSLDSLVMEIDRIEMPSMAGSVLGWAPGKGKGKGKGQEDRAKLWGVLLTTGYEGDPTYLNRLSTFISSSLTHLLSLDSSPDSDTDYQVEDVLRHIYEFCSLGGELIHAMEAFIVDFLGTWDGEWAREVVFDLIALVPPKPFGALHENYLSPLQKLSVSANVSWLADLIKCLEDVVRNWAVRDDWGDGGADLESVFGAQRDPQVNYVASLQSLLSYVDRLVAAGVQMYPESVTFRSAALSFYETSILLPLEYNLAVVLIPCPVFTYRCLIADDTMSLSRICGILSRLRDPLTGEGTTALDKDDPATTALVSVLNAHLLEFINALWQKRLLSGVAGPSAMGLTSVQVDNLKHACEDREQSFSNGFGLPEHAALASIARDCLIQLEENCGSIVTGRGAGPITSGSLKELASRGGPKISFTEFRVVLLERLEECGAGGVGGLLFTSLQSLIARRASLPRSPKSP